MSLGLLPPLPLACWIQHINFKRLVFFSYAPQAMPVTVCLVGRGAEQDLPLMLCARPGTIGMWSLQKSRGMTVAQIIIIIPLASEHTYLYESVLMPRAID